MLKLLKVLAVSLIFAVGPGIDGATDPGNDLEKIFAHGVYWPWECNKASAKAAGKEYWQFVEDFMKDLKEKWNCNIIWFVNGPSPDDLPRVCGLAEKYNIRIMAADIKLNTYFYGGAPLDEKLITTEAEATAAKVKNYKMFEAYVLKDEPLKSESDRMEYFRKAFLKADPARPSIIVSMMGDAETYVKKTGFPVICIDPYLFAYDGDPNTPNPASASRKAFRTQVSAFAEMSLEHGKTPWIMPQAYHEIWGPVWHDANSNLVAEPGAYLHWRFPRESELRWQIWESIRSGNKGVLFFVVLWQHGQTYDPATGKITEKGKKSMENAKSKNWPVIKKRFETNSPSSLTRPDGSPVPQAKAVIDTYAQLQKIEPLLLALQVSDVPYVSASYPAAVQSFTQKESNGIYAIVVNDDFDEARDLDLSFLPDVKEVTDIISGAAIELSPDLNSRMKKGKIRLDAGGGTVLKLGIAESSSAILVFSEDFSCSKCSLKLENAERLQENRSYGMGSYWNVRKKFGKDEKSFILIDGLADTKDKKTANMMKLVNEEKAAAFLKIDGNCPNTEDIVVQFVDKTEGWNKTNGFEYPVEIPAGTKEIKILLNSLNTSVSRIRIWYIPRKENN